MTQAVLLAQRAIAWPFCIAIALSTLSGPALAQGSAGQIHGGPHSQQGPGFVHKSQTYAGHGWAALMVNYRGSTGYGQAHSSAIAHDQNGTEARDILAAVCG